MFSQEGRSKEYQSRGAQGQRSWEQLPEDIHLPDPERRPTDAATRAGRAHPGHTASLQLSGTGTEAEFVQPWLQEASCALLPQQVLRIHVMKGSCRTISGPAPDISLETGAHLGHPGAQLCCSSCSVWAAPTQAGQSQEPQDRQSHSLVLCRSRRTQLCRLSVEPCYQLREYRC